MSDYKIEDFTKGQRVVYVPLHAHGDLAHPDCERGAVSSVNAKTVFVKFNKSVEKFGWDGATAQGCDPTSLEKE